MVRVKTAFNPGTVFIPRANVEVMAGMIKMNCKKNVHLSKHDLADRKGNTQLGGREQ
jgi:hypothetical protein